MTSDLIGRCAVCKSYVWSEPECDCTSCTAGGCEACCPISREVQDLLDEWLPASAFCARGCPPEGDYEDCYECREAWWHQDEMRVR